MKFIVGTGRNQIPFFLTSLEEAIPLDHEITLIDAFVGSLKLTEMGFKFNFIENGRPAYHPADLLRIFIYGYLNRNKVKRKIVNPIIKDTATFLQTSEESDGKVSDIEITLMTGGGNPLHYHKTYSETFTAIDGELGLKLGKKQTKILKPGETHTVEPMSLHTIDRNEINNDQNL